MEGLLLIGAAVIVAIFIRLLAGGMDHDRVRRYVESRGGRVIDAAWSPLGPGWFGEKNERIYSVRYFDRDGNEHEAHCKTSMWSGVYFTEDRIVRYARRDDPDQSLKEENRRLREELARLRQERR